MGECTVQIHCLATQCRLAFDGLQMQTCSEVAPYLVRPGPAPRPGVSLVFIPKGVGREVNWVIRAVIGHCDRRISSSKDARCKAGSAQE